MPQRQSGIYVIENTQTGDLYVGSSSHLDKRRRNHFHELKHGTHHSSYLQRAYNKYGHDTFLFRIIEEVPPIAEMLLQREQHWFDTLQPQYNLCPIAGTQQGLVYSKERLEKQGRGIKAAWASQTEEKREAIRQKAALRRHSDETKRKIGESSRGRTPSEETRKKLSEAGKGKKLSAEYSQRMSEKRTGEKRSEEARKNISQGHMGVGRSEESRRKQSETLKAKGVKVTPEMVAKRNATRKANKLAKQQAQDIQQPPLF
jgi:group I intron endonuclease